MNEGAMQFATMDVASQRAANDTIQARMHRFEVLIAPRHC
jgi:hypothetical protein